VTRVKSSLALKGEEVQADQADNNNATRIIFLVIIYTETPNNERGKTTTTGN
jgi:hypothetical protein